MNKRPPNGPTALLSATTGKSCDVARVLIERGADVNAKDNDELSALKDAMDKEHGEMVELLKRAGAMA